MPNKHLFSALRTLIFTGTFALIPTFLHAQDAKGFFLLMPDSVCPLLTANDRADCIDFLESRMKAEVNNRLGGRSQMTHLDATRIFVQLTPQSTWEMKVMTMTDSTRVIAVSTTVCAPACDSRLRFYSAEWKPLPASRFFTPPVIGDFLNLTDSADSHATEEALRAADLLLTRISFASEEDAIIVELTTPEYMPADKAEKLKPYLRSPIVFHPMGEGRKPDDTKPLPE